MTTQAGPLPTLAIAASAGTLQPAFVEQWIALFSPSERRRLDCFTRPQRRDQFIAAHSLLRLAASALHGIAQAELVCEVEADGRPVVRAPRGWSVSLSHSARRVAVLLQRGPGRIGVDLEAQRAGRDIVAIVAAACNRHAGSRDQAYRMWAVHEARLKAAAHAAQGGAADAGSAADPARTEGAAALAAAARVAAWHTTFDGDALAVAGTVAAPAAIHVFDLDDPARAPGAIAARWAADRS